MIHKTPARTITTKHWMGVRGTTQEGQQFESILENDFYTLLRFDPGVLAYRTQPCQVSFESNARPHIYTPDVLVEYQPILNRCPELIEVKPAKFAKNPDPPMRERFIAATAYSERQGWIFRVVTEEDISENRVKTARFLMRYKGRVPDEAFAALALKVLAEVESASLNALVQMCQQHHENRARLLTELWTLIATRRVGVDLDSELTMKSTVWTLETCELAP
jgi:TnsA endonuclease N terminal